MISDLCRDENHDLCGGALIGGDLHRRACTCSCHNVAARGAMDEKSRAWNDVLDNQALAHQPLIKVKEAA